MNLKEIVQFRNKYYIHLHLHLHLPDLATVSNSSLF